MQTLRLNTNKSLQVCRFFITLAAAFLAVPLAIPRAVANPGVSGSAKDMFYQEIKGATANAAGRTDSGISIAYCLELHRGSAAPVLCNNRYPFRSGDGIRLHVKSSLPVYAYILIKGSSGKEDLLYPPNPNENNRLEANVEAMVPPQGMIVFDNKPGVEKLGIIFSPRPLGGGGGRDLIPSGANIDMNVLTGMPQQAGQYSVYSNDGAYDPGEKAPGSGLVFIHNPDASKATVALIPLVHGTGEQQASSSSSSYQPPQQYHPSQTYHPPTNQSSAQVDSAGSRGGITDKWAFVVGVNHFANFPSATLRYCVADAQSFRDYLVNQCGFKSNHVYFLTDEQATTPNIMRVLGTLMSRAVKPDDLVVLYFSTHGTDKMKSDNFIVTYDFDGSGSTGIPMSRLTDTIKSKINCKRIVTIMDTCFSGNAKDDLDGRALKDMVVGSGSLILTASGYNEKSLEDPALGHGYFTYYLLKELQAKGNKLVSAFEATAKEVGERTKTEHNHDQHPFLNKDKWRGQDDIPLSIPPTRPSG